MKRLFKLLCLATALVAMTGCFQPEAADSPTVNKLLGYWEVVHVSDYNTFTDIPSGEESVIEWSAFITPNDGNEEYQVLHFTESIVTLVATDCQDSVSSLDVPIPYYVTGNSLFCLFFYDPETNLQYGEIETLTEDTLVILMDENYSSSSGLYHDTRRITFRKIN